MASVNQLVQRFQQKINESNQAKTLQQAQIAHRTELQQLRQQRLALKRQIETAAEHEWATMRKQVMVDALYKRAQNEAPTQAVIIKLAGMMVNQPVKILYFYHSENTVQLAKAKGTLKISDGITKDQRRDFVQRRLKFRGFFPKGLYGTTIPPWSEEYTQQRMLKAFYGPDWNADLRWFVAFVPDIWDWLMGGDLNYSDFPGGQAFDTVGIWHWVQREAKVVGKTQPDPARPTFFTGPIRVIHSGRSLIKEQ